MISSTPAVVDLEFRRLHELLNRPTYPALLLSTVGDASGSSSSRSVRATMVPRTCDQARTTSCGVPAWINQSAMVFSDASAGEHSTGAWVHSTGVWM